ncbi:MAG: hypothetical protein ABL982_14810 [Vicinamibacterales bacterium]
MVAKPSEVEQRTVPPATRLEVDQDRFVALRDEDIVGTEIPMCESKAVQFTNDVQNTDEELLLDGLATAQGHPIDLFHDEAVGGRGDEFGCIPEPQLSEPREAPCFMPAQEPGQ